MNNNLAGNDVERLITNETKDLGLHPDLIRLLIDEVIKSLEKAQIEKTVENIRDHFKMEAKRIIQDLSAIVGIQEIKTDRKNPGEMSIAELKHQVLKAKKDGEIEQELFFREIVLDKVNNNPTEKFRTLLGILRCLNELGKDAETRIRILQKIKNVLTEEGDKIEFTEGKTVSDQMKMTEAMITRLRENTNTVCVNDLMSQLWDKTDPEERIAIAHTLLSKRLSPKQKIKVLINLHLAYKNLRRWEDCLKTLNELLKIQKENILPTEKTEEEIKFVRRNSPSNVMEIPVLKTGASTRSNLATTVLETSSPEDLTKNLLSLLENIRGKRKNGFSKDGKFIINPNECKEIIQRMEEILEHAEDIYNFVGNKKLKGLIDQIINSVKTEKSANDNILVKIIKILRKSLETEN